MNGSLILLFFLCTIAVFVTPFIVLFIINNPTLVFPADTSVDDVWQRAAIERGKSPSRVGADSIRFYNATLAISAWEETNELRLHMRDTSTALEWKSQSLGHIPAPEDGILYDLDEDGYPDALGASEERTVGGIRVWWGPDFKQHGIVPGTKGYEWMQLDVTQGMFTGPLVWAGSKRKRAQMGRFVLPIDISQRRKLCTWKWHTMVSAPDIGWVMSLRAQEDLTGDGIADDVLISDRHAVMWFEGPSWTRRHVVVSSPDEQINFLTVWNRSVVLTYATRRKIAQWSPEGVQEVVLVAPKECGPLKAIQWDPITKRMGLACRAGSGRYGVWYASGWPGPVQWHRVSGSAGKKFDRLIWRDLDGDGIPDLITCEEINNLGVIWYRANTYLDK